MIVVLTVTNLIALGLLLWLVFLTKKEIDQVSELSDAVAAIANDVGELQTATQRVLSLLQQPNSDVSAAVAVLQNADAAFDAIRDSLNAAGGGSPTEPGVVTGDSA